MRATPAYSPDQIPPGWGAHIGDGVWVTKCPEKDCGHLIPGTFPVDIQRHLWGGAREGGCTLALTCDTERWHTESHN